MHFQKMVSIFYKDYSEKRTATSALLDSASLMAKPTIQLSAKQKQEQPTRCAKKPVKQGKKKRNQANQDEVLDNCCYVTSVSRLPLHKSRYYIFIINSNFKMFFIILFFYIKILLNIILNFFY